uniref:U3 small nucleolar RNA-associated protein 15 homolog n=1 Tax=Podarcis muralis TaxID=64176 RepID=A0A670JQU1_PODMU
MAEYKPVKVQSFPKLGEKVTKDTSYWKNFKAPIQIKEFGAVNKIDFSPVPPYNYAVTASSRIHIYGRYSQEPIKTFSRFKDVAYCATYRDDGKLLVAGSEEGSIRLFDTSGRAALRQFDGHTKAVHVVGFLSDKFRIVSGADDYTSKVWDISSASEIVSYNEHTDYVRCGCTSKLNADLFVTGWWFTFCFSYSCMPMKCLVYYLCANNPFFLKGGRYVKVWDFLRGGQLLVSLRNHHKTVTCLCLSSSGQRLLSGSLDRHVKVYSTTSYKVVHSFNYAASILSLALAPEDESLVVGMTNGILNVKHRKREGARELLQQRRRPAYRTFVKGKNYMPKQEDFIVSRPAKTYLKKYDKLLRSFQVSKALDAVLADSARKKPPEVIVTVFQELNRRGTLKNALAGRDEKQLSVLLSFLIRHVTDARFAPVLINIAEMIIEIYMPVVGQSSVIDRQFLKLQNLIEKEIDLQEELLEVLGMMDALFATMARKKPMPLDKDNTDGL